MKNPRQQFENATSRVLVEDESAVDAFNAANVGSSDYRIQSQLLPEPFIGNSNANVYLLGLNPGYSPEDDAWHSNSQFQKAIINNLGHRKAPRPFYFFESRFESSPGAIWWNSKCRWLIDDVGLDSISQNLFCVELFPYHSKKYRLFPRSISPNGLVPSAAYGAYLVRCAMEEKKTIIAMRAYSSWCKVVPGLETYSRLHRLNSAQNVSLSPKNLQSYRQILEELQLADIQ